MYDDLFARLLAEGKITRDDIHISESVGAGVRLNRGLSDTMQFNNSAEWKVFHSQRGKFGQWEGLGANHNARTDAGAGWVAGLLGGTGTAAPAKYIGITADATPTAKGDTTLPGEITTAGLGRALGVYTLTVPVPSVINGQVTWTFTNTFTYTGAVQVVVAKGGLFTAASAGILAFETVLPTVATVNANGDQIACVWTVQA